MTKRRLAIGIARGVVLAIALGGRAHAQTPAPGSVAGEPAVDPDRMSPREVHRLFDAYVAMQAQDRLQLNESQYTRFLPRLKALLDLRRSSLSGRQTLVTDLGRLSRLAGTASTDVLLREKLQQLRAFDDRAATDLRRAYEAIDEVLDVTQQARFRVFEDQMERRKLELLMRARQNVRNRAGRPAQR